MGHPSRPDPSKALARSPYISWPSLPNPHPLSQSLDVLPQGPMVDPLPTIQLSSASAKEHAGTR